MVRWPKATPHDDCEEALVALQGAAPGWLARSTQERIALLEALTRSIPPAAEAWVHGSCEAKGIELGTRTEAEEWLGGPWAVLRSVKLMLRSLKDIDKHGAPRLPGRARLSEAGRVIAPVFPTDPVDKIIFRGIRAEVWMERDVTLDGLEETMGWMHRVPPTEPGVSLVLGAGNVSSIAPLDAIFELFARGNVVLLKTNPVNSYQGEAWEAALRPLVDATLLRVVHGGAALGDYLCQHDAVSRIHITGSDRTFDAIVWGTGEGGLKRKADGEKRISKDISSELGNVSPIVIVPGQWSEADIRFHASNVASSLVNNAGFNCLATRVIVTSAGWGQREEFLNALGDSLTAATNRVPYYPGAEERHRKYVKGQPGARTFGDGKGVPWALIQDIDPRDEENICFREESWCGVMAETALPSTDPAQFLADATEFCNDTLWGTLNATILIHPNTAREPAVGRALESAISRLRYGTVGINLWAGAAFALGCTPWGAFPGHGAERIESGQGVVHNTYLFERPEKTVVRAPFRIRPRPAWFHDTSGAEVTARRLFELTDRVTAWRLGKLMSSAMRGRGSAEPTLP